MAKRYDQMLPIVAALKPHTIVEVGVHRGMRAQRLCVEALQHSSGVQYVGYDVFDTMDEQFQEDALNGKGMPSQRAAFDRLAGIRGLAHRFVIGDTRETLHGKSVRADFAFIDGDHRVEAIEGDHAALAGCRVVVFDDYYRPDETGAMPDTTLYGANGVVDLLAVEGRTVEILPIGDRCKHGGMSHLAVVYR